TLGDVVGFKVRFQDRISRDTSVKLMTDGILLAETQTDPLLKAYEAMPTPRRVMAVGTCALTGCLFGPSFASAGGVGSVLPVDVEVPGCPPPPLAILHGLLLLSSRVKESDEARETLGEAAP
ncbi:MAG: hypothetical protein B7Z74_06110, partial [Deltaproteobacteria bacterium 21-66-5]